MRIRLGRLEISSADENEAFHAISKPSKNGSLEPVRQPLEDGRNGEAVEVFMRLRGDSNVHTTTEVFLLSHLGGINSNGEGVVGTCGVFGCSDCGPRISDVRAADSPFELTNLFRLLPSPVDRMKAADARQREANSKQSVQSSQLHKPETRLLDLPEKAIKNIASYLRPKDLRTLSTTCRELRVATFDTVPYLKLKLYVHQVAAVRWMLERERVALPDLVDPLGVRIECRIVDVPEPVPIVYNVNLASRIGGIGELPTTTDCRGGLFCDEPGLGKTITCLALILKTAGMRASAPPGASLQGSKIYLLPHEIEMLENQRFEVLGVSPSMKRRQSESGSPETPKKRRVSRPDFYGVKGDSRVLPSPTKADHSIHLSTATLIVVPLTLVDHWRNQMEQHIRETDFGGRSWIVYEGGVDLEELAEYDIVITTFSKLSAEYVMMRKGVSRLMRIHWLRIILDEGHKLGSLAKTDLKTVCNALRADRRWVITGTPTPNTPNSDVRHLFPLLSFIREPVYGSSYVNWAAAVQKPYEEYKALGAWRLGDLLSRIMIRNSKENIRAIPELHVHTRVIPMNTFSAKQYNEVVEIVQRNLLLAEKFNGDKTHSLIRPQNVKACREALGNLRKSCCISGHIALNVHEGELFDLLKGFIDKVDGEITMPDEGADDQVIVNGYRISGKLSYIARVLSGGGNCEICNRFSRCMIATPCVCLMCAECAEQDASACAKCGTKYELDAGGYPEELIELQPSYTQSHWKRTFSVTATPKIEYLLGRLRTIFTEQEWVEGVARRKRSKVIVFSHYLEHLEMIRVQTKTLLAEFFSATDPPISGVEEKLLPPPPEALEYYMPTHRLKKDLAMKHFRTRSNRPLLLMDIASALGHDLSFVKYVFLMEPIWDRAEELQVISRAHRLGAVEAIEVEKLISSNTIEAMMEEGTKPQQQSGKTERIAKIEKQKKRDEENKRNHLLMSLKLLRNEASEADNDEQTKSVPKTVRFAW